MAENLIQTAHQSMGHIALAAVTHAPGKYGRISGGSLVPKRLSKLRAALSRFARSMPNQQENQCREWDQQRV
jgi:hypothetical protein